MPYEWNSLISHDDLDCVSDVTERILFIIVYPGCLCVAKYMLVSMSCNARRKSWTAKMFHILI